MYQVKNIMDNAEKSSGSEHTRQQKAHTKQMAQYAWNFVNDRFIRF